MTFRADLSRLTHWLRGAICWGTAGLAVAGFTYSANVPYLKLATAAEPAAGNFAKQLAEAPGETKTAEKLPVAKPTDLHDKDYYDLLLLFSDSLDQIERNYVKPISRRELMEAAIRGMLTKLDPHSNYVPPEEMDRFKTGVENTFGGIGITVAIEDERLTIVSPLADTPAYRAGLQAGDTVTEIDGKSTKNVTLDDAVGMLKGKVGTKVTLTVLQGPEKTKKTFTLNREIIRVATVLGDARKADDSWDYLLDRDKKVAYIRITGFGRTTADELKKALAKLKAEGMKALVIDLRFNPGGLLTSAIEISDMFVSSGLIVSTEGRNSPKHAWHAKAEDTYEGFPIAILVNRYSASASEILSACLQDHSRAIVVGERSWGKGSVQNIIEMEDGKSALKLTTAGYMRPSGKNIHRFPDAKDSDEWGVKPNDGFEVKLTEAEMSSYLQYRRERDILLPHPAGKPAEPKTPRKIDPQLAKALAYLDEELKKSPAQTKMAVASDPKNSDDDKAKGDKKQADPQLKGDLKQDKKPAANELPDE